MIQLFGTVFDELSTVTAGWLHVLIFHCHSLVLGSCKIRRNTLTFKRFLRNYADLLIHTF